MVLSVQNVFLCSHPSYQKNEFHIISSLLLMNLDKYCPIKLVLSFSISKLSSCSLKLFAVGYQKPFSFLKILIYKLSINSVSNNAFITFELQFYIFYPSVCRHLLNLSDTHCKRGGKIQNKLSKINTLSFPRNEVNIDSNAYYQHFEFCSPIHIEWPLLKLVEGLYWSFKDNVGRLSARRYRPTTVLISSILKK